MMNKFKWMGVILMLCSLWTYSGLRSSAAKEGNVIFGYTQLSGKWKQEQEGKMKGEAMKKSPALMVSVDKRGGYAEYESTITAEELASFLLGADERGVGGFEVQLDVKGNGISLISRSDEKVLEKVRHTLKSKKDYSIMLRTERGTTSLWVDGQQVMDRVKTGAITGHYGFLVDKGKGLFRQATVNEWRSNLDGVELEGWKLTKDGLESEGGDRPLMSATKAGSVAFEARLHLNQAASSASLIFRGDAAGRKGLRIKVDGKGDQILLMDSKSEKTLQSVSVKIQEDILYHVKIVDEGEKVKVFWQEGDEPLLIEEHLDPSEGYLGVTADTGTVLQDVRVSGLEGNLEGWTSERGEWLSHLQGVIGSSDGEDNAFRMSTTKEDVFILEGDVTIHEDSPYGTAGLIFRSNGVSGYMLQLDPNLGRVRLLDLEGDRTIGEMERDLAPGATHHVELHAVGSSIKVYVDDTTNRSST